MKCVLSIIASAAILAFASSALAAGPSIPFDATYYADYGILLFPCDLNAYATTCELDTGDGAGIMASAATADAAGLTTTGTVTVWGDTGTGTADAVSGSLSVTGAGRGNFDGVALTNWHYNTMVGIDVFASIVGPIFAVNPKTDTVYGTGRETRIYRPIRFDLIAAHTGHYVEAPCQIGMALFPECLIDTGVSSGFIISPAQATEAGVALGAEESFGGAAGQGAAYEASSSVTMNGLAPVGVAGIVSEGYAEIPTVGDAYLKALYPGGYVFNTTDGVISALLPGVR